MALPQSSEKAQWAFDKVALTDAIWGSTCCSLKVRADVHGCRPDKPLTWDQTSHKWWPEASPSQLGCVCVVHRWFGLVVVVLFILSSSAVSIEHFVSFSKCPVEIYFFPSVSLGLWTCYANALPLRYIPRVLALYWDRVTAGLWGTMDTHLLLYWLESSKLWVNVSWVFFSFWFLWQGLTVYPRLTWNSYNPS